MKNQSGVITSNSQFSVTLSAAKSPPKTLTAITLSFWLNLKLGIHPTNQIQLLLSRPTLEPFLTLNSIFEIVKGLKIEQATYLVLARKAAYLAVLVLLKTSL
jgi:hypothetical protein